MNDLLTPEFLEFADKIKKLYEEREAKATAFKELWVKHKAELAEIDKKATNLKIEYELAVKNKTKPEVG